MLRKKWMFGLLVCLELMLIVLQWQEASAGTGKEFTMFTKDLCDKIRCTNRVHTMCFTRTPACLYRKSLHYVIEEFESTDMRHMLVMGHNGFRHRIANRMNVANMNRLVWDNWLEIMALQYADMCTPFEDDECTKTAPVMDYFDAIHTFRSDEDKWLHLSQNRYCKKGAYMPRNIIQLALSSWYNDREYLQAPTIIEIRKRLFGQLVGENNFTHLAYPMTFRFGCSIDAYAMFNCINCIYYPFYRSLNGSMIFEYGPPSTLCSSRFPRGDNLFPSICSDDSGRNAAPHTHNAPWVLQIAITIVLTLSSKTFKRSA